MATLLCLRDVQTFVNLSRHDPTRLTATQPYLLDSIVLTINNALEVMVGFVLDEADCDAGAMNRDQRGSPVLFPSPPNEGHFCTR